jgi:hypothetical protein
MDGEHSLGKNSTDDNHEHHDRVTSARSWGPAGLTGVTNPLHHVHLRSDQIGLRVRISSRRAVLCT